MAWARQSDDMHDHPKVVALTADLEGLAAYGLWDLGLTWVRQDFTRRGMVPDGQVVRFAGSNAKQLASRLVQVRLWDEVPGGYRFHDYEDVYPSQDLSDKRAEAGRRGGVKSGQARRAKSSRSSEHTDASDAKQGEAKPKQNANPTEPLLPLNGSTGSYAANGRNARELEPTNNEPAGPAERILTTWIATLPKRPQASIVRDLGAIVADALHDGVAADDVGESLRLWQVQVNGRRSIGPGVLKSIIHQVSQRDPGDQDATPNAVAIYQGAPPARASTRDANVAAVLALANSYERSSP